jgi:hypothetical protein
MTALESRTPVISYVPVFFVALAFCISLLIHITGNCLGTKWESENLKRLRGFADIQFYLLSEHVRLVEEANEQLKPRFIQAEAELKHMQEVIRELYDLQRSGDEDMQRILRTPGQR